jgi:hypothetical protein
MVAKINKTSNQIDNQKSNFPINYQKKSTCILLQVPDNH